MHSLLKAWVLLVLMLWCSSGKVLLAHRCWTKNKSELRWQHQRKEPCGQKTGKALCCQKQEAFNPSNFSKNLGPGFNSHCCDQKAFWWRPGLEQPKPIKGHFVWVVLGLPLLHAPKKTWIGQIDLQLNPSILAFFRRFHRPIDFLSRIHVFRI